MVTNSMPLQIRTAAIDARFLKEERIGRALTLTRLQTLRVREVAGAGLRKLFTSMKPCHRGLLWRGHIRRVPCG